jgi:hypothetical protein
MVDILRGSEDTSAEGLRTRTQAADITHIEHVIPEHDVVEALNKGIDVFTEITRVFADLPIFGGMVRALPRKGVIRVSVGNNQADKVMMALFIARTISEAPSRTHFDPIMEARARGFSPRAMIIASIFTINNSRYHRPIDKTVSTEYLCEHSIFDPHMFGMKAAKAFMDQNSESNPWYQEMFKVNGYTRDDQFKTKGVEINPLSPVYDDEEDEDSENNRNWENCCNTRYRRLVSCFNVPDDTEPLFEGSELNEYNEFKLKYNQDRWISLTDFDKLLTKLDNMREVKYERTV